VVKASFARINNSGFTSEMFAVDEFCNWSNESKLISSGVSRRNCRGVCRLYNTTDYGFKEKQKFHQPLWLPRDKNIGLGAICTANYRE
jgi:hypothetical protein